eukprot:gnl/TRDRNA2_/TRDRNA2_185145_c0_seq1.p1 gnl/TRDRNA2_/TRDRNA2_185145_c0~~gnl/TRDRNA2_/TRDRNA2_185145_c0_seq1.p1  ORF type:complete len:539 (+),score=108.85 gnl/TRDRNA2_/TRDRNA2_185145_c0_seq1:72-1688(+)
MAPLRAIALLGVVAVSQGALLRTQRDAASIKSSANLATYSFDHFIRDFDRSYTPGSAEYVRREAVFKASLLTVRTVKARNAKDGRSWTSGIHPFMDWDAEERQSLHGYKPNRATHRAAGSLLQTKKAGIGAASNSSIYALGQSGGMGMSEGPQIRQQGKCGSCWAISAAEAVEAQLQRNGADPSTRVAPQALIDCVPNPQHCGGKGGCEGATGELAYSFMRDTGIPLEGDLPYHPHTESCPMESNSWPAFVQKRVFVSGWKALESNKVEPLMTALVNDGPVVVAVDAKPWFDYDSGVFDGCPQDATLGHAVLAKGYGEDNGRKYWLIQNSWGSNWGEHGHIRMLRHDDENSFCGTDRDPQEGLGCDGGPSEVTVCGMCGVLYDPIIPEGVRIEDGNGGGSSTLSETENLLKPYEPPPIFKPPPMPELSSAPNAEVASSEASLDRLDRDLSATTPAPEAAPEATPSTQNAALEKEEASLTSSFFNSNDNAAQSAPAAPTAMSSSSFPDAAVNNTDLTEVDKMKRLLSEIQLRHKAHHHA